MSTEPSHLVVAYVRKPHGTRGELAVESLTDHPEHVFAPGAVLRVADAEGERPDPDLPPLRVELARPGPRHWLVAFGGLEDRSQADLFRARYLLAERDALPPLAEGELFRHQLLGMTVETVAGEAVGEVVQTYEMRPAEMLEVRTATGTVLVPFTEAVVAEVDPEAGRIVIDPPEGLLDL